MGTFLSARLLGCHLVHFLTGRAFFEHGVRFVGRTFLRQADQRYRVFLVLAAAVVHTAQVGFVDAAFFGVDVEFFQTFEKLALLAALSPDNAAGGCGDDDDGEQNGERPRIDD